MEERISGRKPNYGFFSRLTYGVGEIFGGGCLTETAYSGTGSRQHGQQNRRVVSRRFCVACFKDV